MVRRFGLAASLDVVRVITSVAARIVTIRINTDAHKNRQGEKKNMLHYTRDGHLPPSFSLNIEGALPQSRGMACWPLIMLLTARKFCFSFTTTLRGRTLTSTSNRMLLSEGSSVVRTAPPALVSYNSSPPIPTYAVVILITRDFTIRSLDIESTCSRSSLSDWSHRPLKVQHEAHVYPPLPHGARKLYPTPWVPTIVLPSFGERSSRTRYSCW